MRGEILSTGTAAGKRSFSLYLHFGVKERKEVSIASGGDTTLFNSAGWK